MGGKVEYWPADYFIDGKGRIGYHHFGEGEYEKSERIIKTLLTENGATGLDESIVHINAEGPETPRRRRSWIRFCRRWHR